MRDINYHYTRQQLEVMQEYGMTEQQMQLFTQIAIFWDENNRPKDLWITYKELHSYIGFEDMTQEMFRSEMTRMNEACGIFEGRGNTNNKVVSLSEDGKIMAREILSRKSGTMYRRLLKRPEMSGRYRIHDKELWSTAAWARMVEAMRRSIIIVKLRKSDREYVYIDAKRYDDAMLFASRKEFKKKVSVTERLKAGNAPQMLIDKVEIFGEKNMPSWLKFDVQQFLGQKIAI